MRDSVASRGLGDVCKGQEYNVEEPNYDDLEGSGDEPEEEEAAEPEEQPDGEEPIQIDRDFTNEQRAYGRMLGTTDEAANRPLIHI